MHWPSAERTAPLNAPSLTESTKQSLKEGGGGGEEGGRLRAEPTYCTVQPIEMGLGFSISLQLQYCVADSAVGKEKEMVVK